MAITPYLLYEDVGGALKRLAKAFGFKRAADIHKEPDGTITHASMEFDGGLVMMGHPAEVSKPETAGPRGFRRTSAPARATEAASRPMGRMIPGALRVASPRERKTTNWRAGAGSGGWRSDIARRSRRRSRDWPTAQTPERQLVGRGDPQRGRNVRPIPSDVGCKSPWREDLRVTFYHRWMNSFPERVW